MRSFVLRSLAALGVVFFLAALKCDHGVKVVETSCDSIPPAMTVLIQNLHAPTWVGDAYSERGTTMRDLDVGLGRRYSIALMPTGDDWYVPTDPGSCLLDQSGDPFPGHLWAKIVHGRLTVEIAVNPRFAPARESNGSAWGLSVAAARVAKTTSG